ncbi:MAG TPA: metal-sensitive transcriptional regulator [Terriglobales bacterium]|nr:metal-sensitive transcriptional regulator [Terriglobales bacterium]
MSKQRKAVAVEPGAKSRNLKRLKRVEGQVRGIQKMVEGDRYCADILVQVSAVQAALQSVSRELMRNHLRHCASHAVHKSPQDANQVFDEVVDLIYKHQR